MAKEQGSEVLGREHLQAVRTLEEEEAIIERGMTSFVEVGEAMARIKANAKYAPEYESFEEYCRKRWGLSTTRASQTIASSRVAGLLAAHNLPGPESEAAAQPLVRVLNEEGLYDRSTGKLRKPKAGEKAVITAWRKVLAEVEKGRRPSGELPPITAPVVNRVLLERANTGPVLGWFALLGTVGDDLIAARKHLAKAEDQVVDPGDELRQKAATYAEWAEDVAARLRRIQLG